MYDQPDLGESSFQQQAQQAYQDDTRDIEYSRRDNEIKLWELVPEELSELKTLLEGIPHKRKAKDSSEEDMPLYYDFVTGKVDVLENIPVEHECAPYYAKKPIVNREGAEEIYAFVHQHSTKIITLGNIDDKTYTRMVYNTRTSLNQFFFARYSVWQLDFNHASYLKSLLMTIIEMSLSRAIKGNEKAYRSRSYITHEHKMDQKISNTTDYDKPRGINRFLGK